MVLTDTVFAISHEKKYSTPRSYETNLWSIKMFRHPGNSNLTLHYEETYLGLPVLFDKGPFILEYLNRLHQTLTIAIGQYSRVFAFRLDPCGYTQV